MASSCQCLGAEDEPVAKARLVAGVEVGNHATLDPVDDAPGLGDDAPALIRRVDNDPRVLVGPANSRGKPHGPLARGTARLMSVDENDAAYAALKQNYTPVQRLGERMIDLLPIEIAYIEVAPS